MPFFKRESSYLEQISDAPLTYMVRIPSLSVVSGATNCFIVADGGQWLVVDVGPRTREGMRIWRSVREELSIDTTCLQVFLTHLHVDHADMMHALELGDAPVLVPRANLADAAYRFDPVHYAAARDRWAREALPAIDKRAMAFYGPAYYAQLPQKLNVIPVDPGDVVRVGTVALDVVDSSGHAPGHASLYHAPSQTLFNGDHILFDITPVLEACAYQQDIVGVYIERLKAVGAMDVLLHCQAHGALRPAGAHRERADALVARVLRRVECAYDAVSRHPGVSGFGIISRMGWRTGGLMWAELGVDARNCILHNGLAMIDHLVVSGRIRREQNGIGEYRYFLS